MCPRETREHWHHASSPDEISSREILTVTGALWQKWLAEPS
jgi:hypothetical protein